MYESTHKLICEYKYLNFAVCKQIPATLFLQINPNLNLIFYQAEKKCAISNVTKNSLQIKKENGLSSASVCWQ